MTKPPLLVHPPLGLFEMQLGDYEIVHWPTSRTDIRAAVTVGQIGLSNAMIDALPDLGAIVCFGVGVDGVDLGYCKARGVRVTHGREINHEDVADVTIGLLIARFRLFTEGERVLREGAWRMPLAVPPQRRRRGAKLGIVGMGAIGQASPRAGVRLRFAGTGRAASRTSPTPMRRSAGAGALADVLGRGAARGDKSTENIIDARDRSLGEYACHQRVARQRGG